MATLRSVRANRTGAALGHGGAAPGGDAQAVTVNAAARTSAVAAARARLMTGELSTSESRNRNMARSVTIREPAAFALLVQRWCSTSLPPVPSVSMCSGPTPITWLSSFSQVEWCGCRMDVSRVRRLAIQMSVAR